MDMVTLTNEFDFNEEVYILKDSNIIKVRIRYIKMPDISRFDPKPESKYIQYGMCTDEELEMKDYIQESLDWYTWRYAREIGRTKNELLDKLKD